MVCDCVGVVLLVGVLGGLVFSGLVVLFFRRPLGVVACCFGVVGIVAVWVGWCVAGSMVFSVLLWWRVVCENILVVGKYKLGSKSDRFLILLFFACLKLVAMILPFGCCALWTILFCVVCTFVNVGSFYSV